MTEELRSLSLNFQKNDYPFETELEKNERIDKNLLRFVTVKVKKFDLKENYFGKEETEEIKKGKRKVDEK